MSEHFLRRENSAGQGKSRLGRMLEKTVKRRVLYRRPEHKSSKPQITHLPLSVWLNYWADEYRDHSRWTAMLSAWVLFFFPNYVKAGERLALQDGTGLTSVFKNMQVRNFGNTASFYSQPNLIKADNRRLKLESYSGEIKK